MLHFIVPLFVALLLFKRAYFKPYLIMMLGMVIDIDHLLATPIYDPLRCSMGFHPLHTWPFIFIYFAMLFWPKTRLLAIGLLIHMLLDTIDCKVNLGIWMMQ